MHCLHAQLICVDTQDTHTCANKYSRREILPPSVWLAPVNIDEMDYLWPFWLWRFVWAVELQREQEERLNKCIKRWRNRCIFKVDNWHVAEHGRIPLKVFWHEWVDSRQLCKASKLIMAIRLPVYDAGSLLAGGAVVYVLTGSVWAAAAKTIHKTLRKA